MAMMAPGLTQRNAHPLVESLTPEARDWPMWHLDNAMRVLDWLRRRHGNEGDDTAAEVTTTSESVEARQLCPGPEVQQNT